MNTDPAPNNPSSKRSQAKNSAWNNRLKRLEERRHKLNQQLSKIEGEERRLRGVAHDSIVAAIKDRGGPDIVQISNDVEANLESEHERIRNDAKGVRQELRDLLAEEVKTFDWGLRAELRHNLGKLLDKKYHNPGLRMKLATEWDSDMSPPAGISSGTTWHTDDGFEIIEDPVFGDCVNTIHPRCRAEVGHRDRLGEASAWVWQRLTFEHEAPRATWRAMLADEIWIAVSAFGSFEASASNAAFILQSLALGSGGFAQLAISVEVEQEGGIRRQMITDQSIFTCQSSGAFWVIPPFGPILLRPSAPVWGNIREFPAPPSAITPLPILSATDGGPVRVHVTFRCTATANHKGADAEVDFRPPGRIHIHEINLSGETTID